MPWGLLQIPFLLPTFVLVMARISGLMLTAPMFSSAAVPARIRAFFVLTLAACVFPLAGAGAPTSLTLAHVVVGVAGEIMIGAVIGLAFGLIFTGAAVAGQLVGQQAGLRAGNTLSGVFDGSTTAIGDLYFFFSLMVFFTIGGHHVLIVSLLDTYQTTPIMTFALTPAVFGMLNDLVAGAFAFGLRMAAPVVIAMFLTELTLGFMARTMPQINILSVGFLIRVLIGLWFTAAGIGAVNAIFAETFWDAVDRVGAAFL